MKRVGMALCMMVAGSIAQANQLVVVDLDEGGINPRIMLIEHGEVLHEYPIAAPARTPSCLMELGYVTGTITDVLHEASWVPPPGVRRKMARKGIELKHYYGPHDPKNALGGRKFMITWDDLCIDPNVRIHGTIEPEYVHKRARVTSGCIRMLNEEWLHLAERVSVGTTVLIANKYGG